MSRSSIETEDVDSSKKLKVSQNKEMDRFSELPDSILQHILSFLDMREVITITSLISRRWRKLWISLPILNFNHIHWGNDGNFYHKVHFVKFVNKVLLLRDNSKIKKLNFVCSRCCKFDEVIEWMTVAVRKVVEEVYLNFDPVEFIVLPDFIFDDDSEIQVLRLCSFREVLKLPESICFASRLRTLDLDSVRLPEGDLDDKKLVLSCPILENLSLKYCDHNHIKILKIYAYQLKYLVLENGDYCYNGSCELQISTPNLVSLMMKGSLYKDYCLQNLSALGNAKFESKQLVDTRVLVNVLRALHNVTSLELSDQSPMNSVSYVNNMDQLLNPFVNLRHLKLVGWSGGSCIGTIKKLLMNCFSLETLVFDINQVISNAKSWEELFECIYPLKSIEIQGLKVCKDELKFFEFVLKNAVSLESFTVFTDETFTRNRRDKLAEFNMKLHSLPRASSTVKMLLIFGSNWSYNAYT